MRKDNREQILFSCVGSSDPVCGLHDGGMLHILRHYRPKKVLLYISREMRKIADQDHRYELAIQSLSEQCGGYVPEILEPYYGEETDVSDFDGFYDSFSQCLQDLTSAYPDAEILLNISSGTPQMKMTLCILSESLQFRTRAIQVKNFERRSGTSTSTALPKYDLEAEILLNEDAAEHAENRCYEPKLLGLHRSNLRQQAEALLKRYDYDALLLLKESLPSHIMPLIQHLARRKAYDFQQAQKLAASVDVGIELYPAASKSQKTYREYQEISEYILTLKLMQRTNRYTDLVIRLNPLVIRLQQQWLENLGVKFEALGECSTRNREWKMQRDKIGRAAPELLRILDAKYAAYRDGALNIPFCNCAIEWKGQQNSEMGQFFLALERLNNIARNDSAHSLSNVHEEDIQNLSGCSSSMLIRRLFAALADIYPQHYRPELDGIYDSLNGYIRSTL